jgi:putative acetyltransferase
MNCDLGLGACGLPKQGHHPRGTRAVPFIRRARPADVDRLCLLRSASIRALAAGAYGQAQLDAWDRSRGPDELRTALAAGQEVFLVAEQSGRDGDPAGFASVVFGDRPHLWMLYVRPDLAGRGIGQALLVAIERVSRARGAEVLFVAASLNSAPFYEALGYQVEQAFLVEFPAQDGGEPIVMGSLKMKKWLGDPGYGPSGAIAVGGSMLSGVPGVETGAARTSARVGRPAPGSQRPEPNRRCQVTRPAGRPSPSPSINRQPPRPLWAGTAGGLRDR